MKSVIHAWRVFWRFRQMALMRFTAYPKDTYIWVVISVFWTIFNFLYIYLVVRPKGNLGGWTINEIFLLQGVFAMIDSFTWSFFFQNMAHFTSDVFSGQLSTHLLKPINIQFFLMTRTNSYNNVFRFMIGLAVFLYSAVALKLTISFVSVLMFFLLFFLGAGVIYLLWFGLATFCFWTDRLQNINQIIPSLRDFWMIPRSVYSGLLGLIVTSLIPIALIASLPSEVILGRFDWLAISRLAIFALLLFILTKWFFYYSLKKYNSVGQ